MTLTPDQIRLRLEQAKHTHHEESCWLVLDLLDEILPDLVATSQERADEGRRMPTGAWGD
jgi:hypothetical protein